MVVALPERGTVISPFHPEHCAVGQVLAEITQTWSVMALSYETHGHTGTPLLKADENLIETLEDNQVSVCRADS